MSTYSRLLMLATCLGAFVTVSADVGHGPMPRIGGPADASEAARTIEVEMTDNRYSRRTVSVAEGEVIRFVLHNRGQLVHEFNIGTAKMHS